MVDGTEPGAARGSGSGLAAVVEGEAACRAKLDGLARSCPGRAGAIADELERRRGQAGIGRIGS